MVESLLVSVCPGNARKPYVGDFKMRLDKGEFCGRVLGNYVHFLFCFCVDLFLYNFFLK